MTKEYAVFKEELTNRLKEDWGVHDATLQDSLRKRILRNLEAINTRLTRRAEREDWAEALELVYKLSVFAEKVNNARLREISEQVTEACREKDSFQCLATLERFHRLIKG